MSPSNSLSLDLTGAMTHSAPFLYVSLEVRHEHK